MAPCSDVGESKVGVVESSLCTCFKCEEGPWGGASILSFLETSLHRTGTWCGSGQIIGHLLRMHGMWAKRKGYVTYKRPHFRGLSFVPSVERPCGRVRACARR